MRAHWSGGSALLWEGKKNRRSHPPQSLKDFSADVYTVAVHLSIATPVKSKLTRRLHLKKEKGRDVGDGYIVNNNKGSGGL